MNVENFKEFERNTKEGDTKVLNFNKINNIEVDADKKYQDLEKLGFSKFDHFMEHKGLLVSFLLFLIPGFPKDYLCYIMGVSRIPVMTFIIISTVGRFFGTAMLSISGNIARNEQYPLLAVVTVAAIIVLLLVWRYHDKILEILKNSNNK